MKVGSIIHNKECLKPPKEYYINILIFGGISLILTLFFENFLDLNARTEEHLITTIASMTVQIFINMMALIGIFVVFRLQLHISEEAHSQARLATSIAGQQICTNLDQAYFQLPMSLEMSNMALNRVKDEISRKQSSRLADFKRRSHYLVSFVATIFIFSYVFLSSEYLSSRIAGSTFAGARLFFGIFVTLLCIRAFFMIFRFLSSIIQN